jgi:hypothetical protein
MSNRHRNKETTIKMIKKEKHMETQGQREKRNNIKEKKSKRQED